MPISERSFPVEDLTSILQRTLGDHITIENVDWKDLTDPGENFGSYILAVKVTIANNSKTEVLNLVVKTPPPSKYLQELFNSPLTFKKELQFYRDVTPTFLTLLKEYGVKNPEESWFGAKYYGGRMGLNDNEEFDEQAAIVLENLNFSGYATFDRLVGLNKNQTQYAVKQLAKLHAVGIALKIKKPKVFQEMVLPSLIHPANVTAKKCLGEMMTKSLDDLKSIPAAAPYVDSVVKTLEYSAKSLEAKEEKTKEPWATFVHSDFWVNNMLFRTDNSGNVTDMKIVDFQLSTYDYGINDFIFFIMSSCTRVVIDNDFDHMLNLYYESFINMLKTLNVDVTDFPKEELIDQLNKTAPIRFAQCLMMVQVIKSKPGGVPKMEDIESSDSFLRAGTGEVYQQKMLHTVQFFDKRGWLQH